MGRGGTPACRTARPASAGSPEEYFMRGKHAAVRRGYGVVSPSEAHKTDYIHKLEPSGCRTLLRLSKCTSGKSLLTSSRAVCPALITLDSPLSTVSFCCVVYGAVSSRRIPRSNSNQRTSSWCSRRRCRSRTLAELPCRPRNV